MSISRDAVDSLLPDFLPRQRWFAGDEAADASVVDWDALRDELPGLVWALVSSSGITYQLPLGFRHLDSGEQFLEGKGRWVLGDVDTEQGPMLVYDAMIDPELARFVLDLAVPGVDAAHARPLGIDSSNTSVVFDERLILKLFRRVEIGPNPDVEIPGALATAGFPHVAAREGEWRRDGRDLAVVRAFLEGGGDGWQLAQTSLRDVYASRTDPAEAGGDIGPEARRLGQVTAELHLALATAFGAADGEPAAWADAMERDLAEARLDPSVERSARAVFAAMRSSGDGGKAIRVHGDLHLAQVLRTDDGWYFVDFEGEPSVPLAARRQRSSPLRDVAGMLRSFHYAAEVARAEQGDTGDADELRLLAARWEEHATVSFLDR